jgi:hypothetical protein
MVDNVTPYWLYFPQADQYCPPFTNGWSAPLILNIAGYGYMEIKTPFGQTVQTDVTAGIAQFVNLTWTDSLISFSPGEGSGSVGSTIDPSTLSSGSVSDVNTATFTNVVPWNLGILNMVFVAAPTGPSKHHRLLTASVSIFNFDSTMDFYLSGSTPGDPSLAGTVFCPDLPNWHGAFPLGLDFAVGSRIMLTLFSGNGWRDAEGRIMISYQTI